MRGGRRRGGEHLHVLMVVRHRPAHSSHHPQLLIIIVVIHCHFHIMSLSSTCLHHCHVLSMPKVAEGEVTWWWLAGVTKAARHCGC